jgi:hypothetical protein
LVLLLPGAGRGRIPDNSAQCVIVGATPVVVCRRGKLAETLFGGGALAGQLRSSEDLLDNAFGGVVALLLLGLIFKDLTKRDSLESE